jgi:arylsulfatase B
MQLRENRFLLSKDMLINPFLFVTYNAVYSPLQGADAYMVKFAEIEDIQRRTFAAILSYMDDSIGAILEKLREEKLENNTLIFFVSDNGGPTRELTSSNLPIRDGKGSVYEGGNRVPFLIQWKGQLPANRVYENPVISLDIFATAAAFSNALLDERKVYEGFNLIPYLKGEKNLRPHDTLFWRIDKRSAIRVGDWKLLRNPRHGQGVQWELYNLTEDISETNDLAASLSEKSSEMIATWEATNRQMIDPVWLPNSRRQFQYFQHR